MQTQRVARILARIWADEHEASMRDFSLVIKNEACYLIWAEHILKSDEWHESFIIKRQMKSNWRKLKMHSQENSARDGNCKLWEDEDLHVDEQRAFCRRSKAFHGKFFFSSRLSLKRLVERLRKKCKTHLEKYSNNRLPFTARTALSRPLKSESNSFNWIIFANGKETLPLDSSLMPDIPFTFDVSFAAVLLPLAISLPKPFFCELLIQLCAAWRYGKIPIFSWAVGVTGKNVYVHKFL